MSNKEQILIRFYDLHERPTKIAKDLNVVPSYVTKIIKQDIDRYYQEKEYRLKISKEARKIYKSNWNKTHRKSKQDKELDEFVKLQHKQASEELSYNTTISAEAIRKWNPSLYHYTPKGNLVIDKKLNVGADIPRKLNTNVKLKAQKFRKRYCYSI